MTDLAMPRKMVKRRARQLTAKVFSMGVFGTGVSDVVFFYDSGIILVHLIHANR